MAEYVFRGPQPDVDDAGELVHPGDVREFSDPPDCPPWELVPGQEPPPPAGGLAETPPELAAQGILARGVQPAAPAVKPEGM